MCVQRSNDLSGSVPAYIYIYLDENHVSLFQEEKVTTLMCPLWFCHGNRTTTSTTTSTTTFTTSTSSTTSTRTTSTTSPGPTEEPTTPSSDNAGLKVVGLSFLGFVLAAAVLLGIFLIYKWNVRRHRYVRVRADENIGSRELGTVGSPRTSIIRLKVRDFIPYLTLILS